MKVFNIVCFGLFLVCFTGHSQKKKWSLQECINYAIENNISIKQSALDNESASIAQLDAKGNFLPTLNASASNFWNSGLAVDPITNTNSTQTFRSSNYGISLGLTLYDGLRNVKTFQRAKLSKLLSEYNLGNIKDNISLLISNSYLQVLLNKESLKVIQKQHEITKEQKKRTKDLVDTGSIPQGDLLEIEAVAADELTRIVQAQNAVQIALIGLAQTMLIKEYKDFDIEDKDYLVPVTEIINLPVSKIVEKAKETRYEVQIAKQNNLIAQKNLEISKGAYYPTVTGLFNYSTRESNANSFARTIDPNNPIISQTIGIVEGTGQNVINQSPNFTLVEQDADSFSNQLSTNDGISYGLQLNVPIFNGFSVKNAVKRSELNVKRSEYQLEQATLDLESNVYQAYLDAQSAAKAYEASKASVIAQERAYEYAKDRYDVGLMNAFDYSQSKFRFENAQSNTIQSKFDFIFKLKVLELYYGLTLAEK